MIRVTSINFDQHENPAKVALVMDVQTAAMLVRLTGELSGATANPPEAYQASSELYHTLNGMVFNAFWDEGVDGYEREARNA